MLRALRVLKLRWQELSFTEFLDYMKETIFLCDPYLIYMAELHKGDDREISEIKGVKIEKGSIDELEDTLNVLGHCPWEFRCHLHDNVKDFFVAKDANSIQHVSWIYSQGDHNRLLALAERDTEIKHCYTAPTLRGRGIYPRVICSIKKHLEEQGGKRVFMCVHPDNHASIKGIEKAGFKLAGNVRFRKILGMQCSKRLNTADIN